jgi:hypothetical protein
MVTTVQRAAVLAAALAASGLALAGCGGLEAASTGGRGASLVTSGNAPAGAPTKVGADAVTRQLRTKTGDQIAVVPVPGSRGYEAASYDGSGHLTFWATTSGAWRPVGTATYPTSAALGPVNPKVTGGVLAGMSDATFVLTGTFSTDSSVNALAYTRRPDGGWGVIKAEHNGNIGVSAKPVGNDGIGLENAFYLVNGELETADCSATLPMAQCGGDNRVLKYWKWNGTDFALDHAAGLPR